MLMCPEQATSPILCVCGRQECQHEGAVPTAGKTRLLRIRTSLMRLLVLLLLMSACEKMSTEPAIAEMQREGEPMKESWGVHTYVTQTPVDESESRRRLELIADYVAWYETEREKYQLLKSVTSPVVVHLYDANGDSSATVMAREMRYYDAENRLEASGDVKVFARDDTQLATDALQWREQDHTIRTDRFVRITTPTEDVQGYGLIADEGLETYQLGRFTARVVIEE